MPSKLSALIRHESLAAERQLLRAIGRASPKIARAPSQKAAIALMPQTPFDPANVKATTPPRKPRELSRSSAEH